MANFHKRRPGFFLTEIKRLKYFVGIKFCSHSAIKNVKMTRKHNFCSIVIGNHNFLEMHRFYEKIIYFWISVAFPVILTIYLSVYK